MTRERRLAIQMWEEIKKAVIDAKRPMDINAEFVAQFKYVFCAKHEISWLHGCWFCKYVRYHDNLHGEGCQRCPLSDGHKGAILGYESGCCENAYNRVLNARQRKTKLKACDEILRILYGRLK